MTFSQLFRPKQGCHAGARNARSEERGARPRQCCSPAQVAAPSQAPQRSRRRCRFPHGAGSAQIATSSSGPSGCASYAGYPCRGRGSTKGRGISAAAEDGEDGEDGDGAAAVWALGRESKASRPASPSVADLESTSHSAARARRARGEHSAAVPLRGALVGGHRPGGLRNGAARGLRRLAQPPRPDRPSQQRPALPSRVRAPRLRGAECKTRFF